MNERKKKKENVCCICLKEFSSMHQGPFHEQKTSLCDFTSYTLEEKGKKTKEIKRGFENENWLKNRNGKRKRTVWNPACSRLSGHFISSITNGPDKRQRTQSLTWGTDSRKVSAGHMKGFARARHV